MTGPPGGTTSVTSTPCGFDTSVGQKSSGHALLINGETSKKWGNLSALHPETVGNVHPFAANHAGPMRPWGDQIGASPTQNRPGNSGTDFLTQSLYAHADRAPSDSGRDSRNPHPVAHQPGLENGGTDSLTHREFPLKASDASSRPDRLASLLAGRGIHGVGPPGEPSLSNGSLGPRVNAGPVMNGQGGRLTSELPIGSPALQSTEAHSAMLGNRHTPQNSSRMHADGAGGPSSIASRSTDGGPGPMVRVVTQPPAGNDNLLLRRPDNGLAPSYDVRPLGAQVSPGTSADPFSSLRDQMASMTRAATPGQPSGSNSEARGGPSPALGRDLVQQQQQRAGALMAGRQDAQWGIDARQFLGMQRTTSAQAVFSGALAQVIPHPELRDASVGGSPANDLRFAATSAGLGSASDADDARAPPPAPPVGAMDAATREIATFLRRSSDSGGPALGQNVSIFGQDAGNQQLMDNMRAIGPSGVSLALHPRMPGLPPLQQGSPALSREAALLSGARPASLLGSLPPSGDPPQGGPNPGGGPLADRPWSLNGGQQSGMPGSLLHELGQARLQEEEQRQLVRTMTGTPLLRPQQPRSHTPAGMLNSAGAPSPHPAGSPRVQVQGMAPGQGMREHLGGLVRGRAPMPSGLPAQRPEDLLPLLVSSGAGAVPSGAGELRALERREPSGAPSAAPAPVPWDVGIRPPPVGLERRLSGSTVASGDQSPRNPSPQPQLSRVSRSPSLSRPPVDPEGRVFEAGHLPSLTPDEAEITAFKASLHRHLSETMPNAPSLVQSNLPKLGGKPVDLLAMYREVGLRGGPQKVQDRKWWKRIGDVLTGAGKHATAMGHQTKGIFMKYLNSYSNRWYKEERWKEQAEEVLQQENARKAREKKEAKSLNPPPPKKPRPPKAKKAPAAQGVAMQHHPELLFLQNQVLPPQQSAGGLPKRTLHQQAVAARELAQQEAMQRQRDLGAARILDHVAPAPGPYLVVPHGFEDRQAEELEMALLGGDVHTVSWAINIVCALSCDPGKDLLLPEKPGILRGLLHVLRNAITDDCDAGIDLELLEEDCLPPSKRAKFASSPADYQGWWWAKEAGLVDQGAADERFTLGVAASMILRNLSCIQGNHSSLSDATCMALWEDCLKGRDIEMSEGMNELSRNILFLLQQVAATFDPSALPDKGGALVAILMRTAEFGRAPLQLRKAAASVTAAMLDPSARPLTHLQPIIADKGEELLASAMNLLMTPICMAEEAMKDEANGELGPTEVDPAGVAQEALLQASNVLHAETLEAACNMLRTLAGVSFGDQLGLRLLVGQQRCLKVLVGIITGAFPAEVPENLLAANMESYVMMLRAKMYAHVAAILKAVEEEGLLDVLKWYEYPIAVAAMEKPHLSAQLCGILIKLAPPPLGAKPRDSEIVARFADPGSKDHVAIERLLDMASDLA